MKQNTNKFTLTNKQKMTQSKYSIIHHTIAIYIIYIISTLLQEYLAKNNKIIYLLFTQSLIASCYSYRNYRISNYLFYQYLRIGILKTISYLFSYTLIKFMNFPVLMILKCTKIIPLVILQYFVFDKKDFKKILKAFFIAFGVYLFVSYEANNMKDVKNIKNGNVKNNDNKYNRENKDGETNVDYIKDDDKNDIKYYKNKEYHFKDTKNNIEYNKDNPTYFKDNIEYNEDNKNNILHSKDTYKNNIKKSTLSNTIFFISMMIIDTFINHQQDVIFKKHKVHFFHMMYFSNLIMFCITFLYMFFSNEYFEYFNMIIYKFNDFISLLIFSILNVAGQVVVYSMIQNYGTVNLNMVNITRKMVSICLSIVIFGHSIGLIQSIGIFLVFGSFFIEIFRK